MSLRFIDLFAGLGGFHVGLKRLGMECVFASELNAGLQDLYARNHHIKPAGDIRKVDVEAVPAHDLLCAGFPCQPFSKAGSQEGMSDEERGNLFYDILHILKRWQPQFLLLENVANLHKHDKGTTWRIIESELDKAGYQVASKILSPHQFGIPQLRQRMFIVGERKDLGGLKHFIWPEQVKKCPSIQVILEEKPEPERRIINGERKALNIWQRFLEALPQDAALPSFPIWATEYKATYPFEGRAPEQLTYSELAPHAGRFGQTLSCRSRATQKERLPTYAHSTEEFPNWKKAYIRQNRKFLTMYEKELAPIIEEIQQLPFSWQKFEWNCKGAERDVWKLLIQFRPSGIRVKQATYSPTLVAFTRTQVPALGWKERYMTLKEAAALQSLGAIELPTAETTAFRALGNAVNAEVVYQIATSLISCALPSAKLAEAPQPKRKKRQPKVKPSLELEFSR